ncbi:MAG: SDR family oxidoreductase [Candidatus Neomarinimicrobiota bacterium]
MRRVFITGSSRGIGLGLVRHSLARGDRVFASCRSPEQAFQLNELQQEHGDRLTVLPLDVTDPAAIQSAAATVGGLAEGLDILYNNAGVGGGENDLGHVDGEDLVQTFRVNSVGPLLVSQALLPLLRKGDRPVIAGITSRMGSIDDNGSGGYYAYRASKAALNMVTTSLAVDLSTAGIIAVVLHPGWVRTDMGGKHARISVDKSVKGMLKVVDGLGKGDSGRFLAWDGEEIPW